MMASFKEFSTKAHTLQSITKGLWSFKIRPQLTFAALLSVFFVFCFSASSSIAAISSPQEQESLKATLPSSMADLPVIAKTSQELLGKISGLFLEVESLTSDQSLIELKSKIDPTIAETAKKNRFSEADLARLMDIDAELSLHSLRLNQLIDRYQSSIHKLETANEEVHTEQEKWASIAAIAQIRSAPIEVIGLIAHAQQSLSENTARLHPESDRLLISLSQAIELRSILDGINNEIAARRQVIGHELIDEDHEPLYTLSGPNQSRFENAMKALRAWSYAIKQYVSLHWTIIVLMAVSLGLLTRILRNYAVQLIQEHLAFSVIARGALRISGAPIWLSVFTILLGLNLAPQGPIAYYDLIWLMILAPVMALAQLIRGSSPLVTIYALGLALIPFPFRTILEPMPWVDRWVLNLQATLVFSALLYDYWKRRGELQIESIRWVVLPICLGVPSLLMIGVAANIMGRTGLAKEIIDGLVASAGFLMVYTVAKDTAFLFLSGLIRSPAGKLLRTSSSDPRSLLTGAHHILVTISFLMIIWGVLYAFRIDALTKTWLLAFWRSSISLGQYFLPTSALITASALIAGTFLVLRVSRFALEREILPRLRLAAGVPFAITTLTQYIIALLGFVLAMTSLGIDITKISILAGAVGVGVGFGLQNIFNNFISGLILLFERPVHVGDVIELGNLRGAVTRIGIRSSTIKTPTGAEVIVPNADIISKEVVNWTLSDRKRRIEINVGVDYQSSIPNVLDLLVAQAKATESVLDDPPPMAIFSNFGESSLDFVLYAWIERYEDNMIVASRLRLKINEEFSRAGINIPFPQRDVHLRPQQFVL
jgi:small-conductance mechanosensitive channel